MASVLSRFNNFPTERAKPSALSGRSFVSSDFKLEIGTRGGEMAQVVTCLDQPSTYRDNRSEVSIYL